MKHNGNGRYSHELTAEQMDSDIVAPPSDDPLAPQFQFTATKGRVITTISASSREGIINMRKHYLTCGWGVSETVDTDGKVIFKCKEWGK